MRRALATSALAALATLSTACAFGNRHINLSYPPQRDPGATKSSVPAPQTSVEGVRPVTVVLVDFLDQRPNMSTVGSVHNGFGMHTADVIAQNSVPAWVTSAVAIELRKVGFTVIEAHARQSSNEHAVLTGEVLTAYCGAWTKYEGDVSFAARVESKGKELLRKTYQGKIDSMTNWGASGKSYGLALSAALETAARSLAAELGRDLQGASSP